LLASRLKIEELPGALKDRLRNEIGALDASATFAKVWLVLGPLKWPEPGQLSAKFPSEVPGQGRPFAGLEGPVRWGPKLVDPEQLLLALDPPHSPADALYTMVTFVEVPGSEPCAVRLKLVGSAAGAQPAPVVWLNREPAGGAVDSAARQIRLKPGLNEIVIRLGATRDVREPITIGMSLTDLNGKRSKEFKFFDLITHLRSRSTPPSDASASHELFLRNSRGE
jgi:hypothetical protein